MSRWLIFSLLFLVCAGCGSDAPEPAADDDDAPATLPQAPTRPAPPMSRARIAPEVDGLEVALAYTSKFYSGELDGLFAEFSDEMKAIMPLEQLEQNHAEFAEKFGREIEMVYEESKIDGDQRSFVRWARFENHDGVIGVQWILHPDDSVAGFFIRPAEPTR